MNLSQKKKKKKPDRTFQIFQLRFYRYWQEECGPAFKSQIRRGPTQRYPNSYQAHRLVSERNFLQNTFYGKLNNSFAILAII